MAAVSEEQALRAGRTSILIWAIASVVVCVLLLIVGMGHFGTTPEYAKPPATTTGSSNP